MQNYKYYNDLLLRYLSYYLNNMECSITPSQINKITKLGVSINDAYRLLLIEYLEITDKTFIEEYFYDLVHLEDLNIYKINPYYQNIKFRSHKFKDWHLTVSSYKPFELFVSDDFRYIDDKVIPTLGFFDKPFYFPAIYQNDRLWMSVTPNEINTMKEPIDEAYGKVLTFGLGLGYFSYMCSLKNNVTSITIIEKDQNVISLFKKEILPQFENPEKIIIINDDAYHYMENNFNDNIYDYVFVDIYHDASDGTICYLKFQEYEVINPNTTFKYWIEKTIKYYLK